MGQVFSLYSPYSFTWLAPDHLAALAVIIAANVLLYRFGVRIPLAARPRLRKILAVILVLQEVALEGWEAASGTWGLTYSLPLQLCSVSLLLTALMLYTGSRRIYQVAYFWGVAGAAQALLTPELYYGFPHFVFWQFFCAHGLIVTGCLWMTFVEGLRPDWPSLGRAFAALNIYAAFIGMLNLLTGSNYLFLCRKPVNPSILDYLGDWPWYILSLEIVALAMFLLCALPFMGKAVLPQEAKRYPPQAM